MVIAPSAPGGENRVPTAVITSFASGVVGESLALSGAASSDPDGDPLTYRWVLGDGTEASGADVVRRYQAAGAYLVTLAVSDGRGGNVTTTRTITIVAPPAQNRVPTAAIVAPSTAVTGQPVILASTGSIDPDGDPLSFVWAFGDGATGSGASSVKTYAAPGPYTITLQVSDGRGGFATATHAITVSPPAQTNGAPTAVIVAADRVLAGRPLLVNGGASSDPDGDPLTFAWSVEGGESATGANAAFTFASAGTVTLSLTVRDGRGGTGAATKSIRVDAAEANRAPRAVIAGATAGVTGVELVFDGRGSSDPDGDPLQFAWTLGPEGASAAGPVAAFTYEPAGPYTVTLTVTDTAGNSDTATRTIAIETAPDRAAPIVTLAGPVEALPGAQALFTAVATDNVGVAGVRFEVDGLPGADPTDVAAPPYTRTLALPAIASPGQQVRVTALARDAAGNVGTASATVTITNLPDTTEPSVALIAPPRAAAGETVALLARVGDDRGIARVVFLIDGTEVGSDETAPYEASAAMPSGAAPGTTVLALARAIDLAGHTAESAAAITIAAAADTAPPTVALDVPAEVVAGTPLPLAATAQDDTGVAAVVFDVDGAALPAVMTPPYTAAHLVPASALPGSRLSVRARARDFAGNAAEDARPVKVIAPPSSTRGVVTGEVYDDTTGLPLPGAAVALTGVDTRGASYSESTTSDERGRYLLRAAAGQGRLVVTRAGYTRVDRAVSIAGGFAVEAFDARLTPLAGREVIVSSVLGGAVDEAGLALSIAPGSLAADASLRLVGVGQQGLANRLPAGWSPVAAVEVLPRAAGRWVARAMVEVDAGGQVIAGEVPGGGQYAFLLADTLPAAPPAAVAGSPVPGVTSPVLPTALDASLAPRPRVLFYAPGARSVVTGSIAGMGPLSSGAHLQARVGELYEFRDGGAVATLPFVADLTFHQVGAGADALGAVTPVSPSLTFEPIALREGVITVDLFVPADGLVAAIAGPDGATVPGPDGEVLSVPFG
ncbi:MAG: PKD domain-containing protein, partial [Vicinamibacterales bacterium]|nr:PKD domain-containing protein [Vicinamibacterales bacterium]